MMVAPHTMTQAIKILVTQWIRSALRWMIALGLVTLGAGLIVFPIMIGQTPTPSWKKTDAIVIFTGEIDREKMAIALYRLGLAPKLHISGRYHGFRPGKSPFITFDTAETTEKNALLSYDWMVKNHIRSVRLVTSDYHMPRCLIWASQHWKNVEIIPHPIVIKKYTGSRFVTIILLEYYRYIYAILRVAWAKVYPLL